MFFTLGRVEAAFWEIRRPHTPHLAPHGAETSRMCGLTPQVGADAVVPATQGILCAEWLEGMVMHDANCSGIFPTF